MNHELDEDLEAAHAIGTGLLTDDVEDVIFPYSKKIYRTSLKRNKPKTKLICSVLAELVSIENKGTDSDPAHEYLFRVQGNHFDYTEERYFQPKNLTSNRTFTSKLMSMVPFGKFYGNTDDFSQFFMSEVEKYH